MLFALAAGVLSVLGGAFMPPLLIPAAAAIGFIGNAYGTLYCGIALAVSLGGIAALLSSNVLTMLCIAGFVLLSSVTLGIGLRKRLPYRLLAVLVAFFALAALYLDTALPSLLAGKEPFAGMVELFYQLEDAYKQAGLDISSLQLSTEVLPEVFYGVLIALAEGVGFLTVVLAKWFSTKAKADVPSDGSLCPLAAAFKPAHRNADDRCCDYSDVHSDYRRCRNRHEHCFRPVYAALCGNGHCILHLYLFAEPPKSVRQSVCCRADDFCHLLFAVSACRFRTC